MTGENGYPETPEWSCEPHPCPLPHIAALSGTMPPAVGIATDISLGPSPFDTRPARPEIPANVILGCE